MNQSKNLFNLMAILAVTAIFALVGCDDSSTEPENPADALVGTWELTNYTLYYGASIANADSSFDLTDRMGSVVITFNADGTGLQIDDGSQTGNWTYTATADEITITGTEDGETDVVVIPYELSGNTLTFTHHVEADPDYEEPESWTVQTFTKQ